MFDLLKPLIIFSLAFFVMFCCAFYFDTITKCGDKIYGPLGGGLPGLKLDVRCNEDQDLVVVSISGEDYVKCICSKT